MKHILPTLCISLGLFTLMAKNGNAVPSWFAGALAKCKHKIPGDLIYQGGDWICHMESSSRKKSNGNDICTLENIRPIKVTDDMKIGDGYFKGVLDQSTAGLGKCCTFDDNGNILDKQIVHNGNDECTAVMNKNPKAKHSGIWWYVNKAFPLPHLSLDWWYKGK